MTATVHQARKILSDTLTFNEEEVAVYHRRLRELGLMPEGRGGKGDDASAPIEIENALMLFFALMSGETPKRAPAEAIAFGSLRLCGGGMAREPDEAGERTWSYLTTEAHPPAWQYLVQCATWARVPGAGRDIITLDFTRTPEHRLAQITIRNDAILPGVDRIVLDFLSPSAPDWLSWDDVAKLPRRRCSAVGGSAFYALVDLFGPLGGEGDMAAAMDPARSEAVKRFYAAADRAAKGEGV